MGRCRFFRVMIRDFLAKHRRVIEQHSVEGQTVLLHPLDLVSRIFREGSLNASSRSAFAAGDPPHLSRSSSLVMVV